MLNQIRKKLGTKKVGHAGTLDPLAGGVLVVGIGREATKQLGIVVAKEKEYVATVRMGMTSTTDDEEGEKSVMDAASPPTAKTVAEAVQKFIGTIEQTPPIYSAIKIKGREAYKYARKGKEVVMEPRKVLIKEIELLEYAWPLLALRVVTGPGVYIRSLARDIGQKLGVGGYLADLERTRVGEYSIEDAIGVDAVEDKAISVEDVGDRR